MFYMTGEWPEIVRFLNRDPTDLRWANLNASTIAERHAEEAAAKALRDEAKRQATAQRARIRAAEAEARRVAREAAVALEREAAAIRRAERKKAAAIRQKERKREYNRNNPHIRRAAKSKRRAMIRNGRTPSADNKAIQEIYRQRQHMSELLGTAYHVDHVIPLAKGGLHHEDNLVLMRSDWNEWKSDHLIPEIIRFFTPFEVPEDK